VSNGQWTSRAVPMEGDGAYNRGAMVQAAHSGSIIPLLEATTRRIPLDNLDVPLVLADYGCAQGASSLEPMRTAIAVLRDPAGPDRPICVVHNDQPDNDFASLFRLLEEDPNSYLRNNVNVFPSAVGRSFYHRLLPSSSVALGWSSNAVHWLSRVPVSVTDTWNAGWTNIPDVRATYVRQSDEDWREFLRHRGEELRRGGRLLVSMGATADNGALGWDVVARHMHAELTAMSMNHIISLDEYAQMVVPTVLRSREALLAPFGADGRFGELAVEHLDIVLAPDPIWEEFLRSGDATAYGRRWATACRVTFAPSLAAALMGEQRVAFLNQLEEGLAERFATEPEPVAMWFARIIIARLES
jgi:hypothetical protein